MSSPIHRIEDDDDEPFDRVPSWLSIGRPGAEAARLPDTLEPTFSGDRALIEFRRRLVNTADGVPEPPLEAYEQTAESLRPMMWRFLSLAGVAAVIAWGIVSLTNLKKSATEVSQIHREASTEAGRTNPVDARGMTEASPRAQVAATPLSDPPAESVLAYRSPKPSAATQSLSPAARSVAEAVAPARRSVPEVAPFPDVALTSPAAAATTAAPGASPGSPSAQARTDLAVPATTRAPLDPASGHASAQLVPAAVQGGVSAALAPASQPSSAAVPGGNPPAPDVGEVAMLLSRGKDFLSAGDLSSAQLLFRRAAEAGSAEAALALASTYDPRYLAAHNVVGVPGDEVKARTWYQRAAALGSPQAARMLAQQGAK